MKKFDTMLSRFNEIINMRRKRIEELRKIINDKDNKGKYDIPSCKLDLKSEQNCLIDMITKRDLWFSQMESEFKQILRDYCDYEENNENEEE